MLCNFLFILINHLKYWNIISNIYKNEHILQNLSVLFNAEFKLDWIGRMYAVLNPNIKNGKYDYDSQIFEYNDNGLNNEAYVEKWIMTNLNIANNFINTNNLFELLTYKLIKLDIYDNYLLIIEPITLKKLIKSIKLLLIELIILLIIIVTFMIFFI